MLEALFSAVAEAVFGYLLQEAGLADRVRAVLGVDPERRAFQSALTRAYAAFARQYPELTAALFDEAFLTGPAAPLLAQWLTRRGHPDPAELARRWAQQLGHSDPAAWPRLPEATRAAADFLRWLEAELAEQRALWPLWDARALGEIRADLKQVLQRLQEGSRDPADLEALHRAIASGQVILATGERAVAMGGSANDVIIVTGDNDIITVFKGPDADALRRIFRQVQDEIAADRYACALQDYFRSLREYCRNLPYLTLYDIRPPKKLDEVYVPLQMRQRKPETEPGPAAGGALSVAEVLQRTGKPHLFILGEPGAGKSTLLRQLAEHAWDDPQAIGLPRPHLPMLVQITG